MLLMTRSIFFFLLDDVMMSGSFFQTHFTINKPYEKALTIKKKTKKKNLQSHPTVL